jgi:hypothetical protein
VTLDRAHSLLADGAAGIVQSGVPAVGEGRFTPDAVIHSRRGRYASPVLDSSRCFHSDGGSPAMPVKNRVSALTSE